MAFDLPVQGGRCPSCGHPEERHAYWSPDDLCDGWAHCREGRGEQACRCWRAWPRIPTDEECQEDENRFYGHVTQIGSSGSRGMVLLRCPRCDALYENNTEGDDATRRLTESEAKELYREVLWSLRASGNVYND